MKVFSITRISLKDGKYLENLPNAIECKKRTIDYNDENLLITALKIALI